MCATIVTSSGLALSNKNAGEEWVTPTLNPAFPYSILWRLQLILSAHKMLAICRQ